MRNFWKVQLNQLGIFFKVAFLNWTRRKSPQGNRFATIHLRRYRIYVASLLVKLSAATGTAAIKETVHVF
jgi:hypothetical protein